jgi:C4-dicarboxylate-specific signal transduction histidine kinase
MEQALRKAEKLAANGQLAVTIAHEVNNPMQALSNLISLIGYDATLSEKTRKVVSPAESEMTRIAHITQQMLSCHSEQTRPGNLNLSRVLDEVFELFTARLRTRPIHITRQDEFSGFIEGTSGKFSNSSST